MNGENGNGSAIVIAETASTLAPVDIKKRLDRFAVKKAKEMEEVFAGLKVEERPKYLAEMGIPVNYSEMPTEVRMTQFQKVAIIYAGANAGKFFADELKGWRPAYATALKAGLDYEVDAANSALRELMAGTSATGTAGANEDCAIAAADKKKDPLVALKELLVNVGNRYDEVEGRLGRLNQTIDGLAGGNTQAVDEDGNPEVVTKDGDRIPVKPVTYRRDNRTYNPQEVQEVTGLVPCAELANGRIAEGDSWIQRTDALEKQIDIIQRDASKALIAHGEQAKDALYVAARAATVHLMTEGGRLAKEQIQVAAGLAVAKDYKNRATECVIGEEKQRLVLEKGVFMVPR